MLVLERNLSVAVFNCGYTSPNIQKERGQYHDFFASLLEPAAGRAWKRNPKSPRVNLDITGWDTANQVYPPTLDGINAIIVSGSPNGAYEDLEWIRTLNAYILDVHRSHPQIKLYGSCFGHQIICQALFSSRGVVVEKNPSGWELGVRSIDLSHEFSKRFSTLISSQSLRLQFIHGDHVIIPSSNLPDDIHLVGSTPHCKVQGIYQPTRVLTYQAHPEFDQFISTECLKLVGKRVGWETGFTDSAVASADQSDDAAIAADLMIAFFLEPEFQTA